MNTSEYPICDACSQASPVTGFIGQARICDTCRPAVMAEIAAKRERGESVSAMAIAQDLRPPEERGEFSPSVAQIRAFMEEHDLTGAEAARLAYLSGSQAVRKYTGGSKPHRMSGAVWFCLHAHMFLPEATIAEIERRMLAVV